MIEKIYQRAGGMAVASHRAFSPVREPAPGPVWGETLLDPFTVLEDELTAVVDGLAAGDDGNASEGSPAVSPVSRASSSAPLRRRPTFRAPRSATERNAANGNRWSPGEGSTAPAQWQGLAATATSDRWKQASVDREVSPIAPSLSDSRDAWTRITRLGERGAEFQKQRASSAPQFSYGDPEQSRSESVSAQPSDFPAGSTQRWREEGLPAVARDEDQSAEAAQADLRYRPVATKAVAELAKREGRSSTLVDSGSLIHLLKRNAAASPEDVQPQSLARRLPEDAEKAESSGSLKDAQSPKLTVDGVLDELEDRLRFEFLRTYGSSGA